MCFVEDYTIKFEAKNVFCGGLYHKILQTLARNEIHETDDQLMAQYTLQQKQHFIT